VHLFSPTAHEKILAGSTDWGLVWIADVSAANSRVGALEQLLARVVHHKGPEPAPGGEASVQGEPLRMGTAEIRLVPTLYLVGERAFCHAAGPHVITVEDVQREEGGNLVVLLRGLRADKRYGLVFDGEQWRRE